MSVERSSTAIKQSTRLRKQFSFGTCTVHSNYQCLDAWCQWHGEERTRRAGRAPAWERTLIGRSTAKMSSDDHPAQTQVNDAVQIRLALLLHTVARRGLLSICRHRVQLVSEFIRRVWLPPSPSLTLFLLLLSLL